MKPWPFPTHPKPEMRLNQVPRVTTSPQERAQGLGVRFIHMHRESLPGGCTVAYRPTSDTKNCKVLEIAVAYTHPNDTYCKKTGIAIAAQRWLDGEVVQMPLRGKTIHETTHKLWMTFYYIPYGLI